MKTLFTSVGVFLMLGCMPACGTGESISIAVNSSARVVDAQGEGIDGIGVRFDIYKNEDLKFTYQRTTAGNGYASQAASVSFNMKSGDTIHVQTTTTGTGSPVSDNQYLPYGVAKESYAPENFPWTPALEMTQTN